MGNIGRDTFRMLLLLQQLLGQTIKFIRKPQRISVITSPSLLGVVT
jgi:hypothetical protein